jgi:hypothetical protein
VPPFDFERLVVETYGLGDLLFRGVDVTETMEGDGDVGMVFSVEAKAYLQAFLEV